jgi:hypothetical protein
MFEAAKNTFWMFPLENRECTCYATHAPFLPPQVHILSFYFRLLLVFDTWISENSFSICFLFSVISGFLWLCVISDYYSD